MFKKLKILGALKSGIGHLSSNRQPAFSLVEIMIALFIISMGLTGILSLIGQNLRSQSYNKSSLMAYQLAQEGIELIRYVRDTNWRADRPYNEGLGNNTYYMDYNDDFPIVLSNNSDHLLRQDTNGFYQHGLESTATSSGFYRSIFIKEETTGSLSAEVTVTWLERQQERSYVLKTNLYDWKNMLFTSNP